MRLTILAVMCALAVSGSAAAQQAPQAPQPPQAPQQPQRTQTQTNTSTTRTTTASAPAAPNAPPAPPAPARTFQAVNVKIEFTITDQRSTAAPIKRTVSIITSDGMPGRVRSTSTIQTVSRELDVPLNVDATPMLLPDGKIRVQFTLGYNVPYYGEEIPKRGDLVRSDLSDGVSLVLTEGKSVVAAQSSDPIGDRKVTVEVVATVVK